MVNIKGEDNMDYVYIGKIVNTHGIKGELRIRSDFELKDVIFKPGFTLYVGEGHVAEEIVTYRPHKEFDMVTFKGYNNINQVLNYLKMNVYVKRSDLELSKDEYILDDLVGLFIQENGEMLGKVEEIVYNGINILLSVVGENNFYIPKNGNFIKKVDLEKGIIETEGAKGLII
ncbi:MAG: 16S rRNA processing protein RimM [Bacilli bacterium]|nr:16S rRNA processing protein RimM [Bacilli bacterium]